ncbi:MAG: hypothetical protein IJS30_00145 [Bacteroidales bacterium]|nr:hypothetical protein [Bacteroidales bacterium]
MKKFQFGFLAAGLLLSLSLSSCKKDIGQISFPETTVDTYEISAGQTVEISMSVDNLQDGQISVSAEMDNADYDFTLPEIEGNSFKMSVTAPDFIKEQAEVTLLIEVADAIHPERDLISRTITITAKPEANLFRVAQKANCLISEPGKIVCFKAFKGNSGDSIDFDSANLIWQDQQNLVSKVIKSDDEIAVWLADGVCGNALVGAYKDGALAWTYHLWVINDNPAATLYEYTNGDGVKFSFIDRNLGATAANSEGSASCLYYYWGNKHPYAGGASTVYDIEGNALEYTTEETAVICSENSLDDIFEYSLTRPMTYFASNTNKTGNYEWLFIHKDSAKWEEKADLWGGVSGSKSVYDPCPEGYKVPSFAAMDAFKAANTTQEKQYNGEAANKNFFGWGFTNESGSTFLPAAGDFNNSAKYEAFYNGENTFPTAYLWAADMQVANFRATCFKGTPGSAAPAGQPMGYALNIRCVKE